MTGRVAVNTLRVISERLGSKGLLGAVPGAAAGAEKEAAPASTKRATVDLKSGDARLFSIVNALPSEGKGFKVTRCIWNKWAPTSYWTITKVKRKVRLCLCVCV